VALKKLGRPGEAEAAFQRSIALAPGDTEAIYNLGNLIWKAASSAPRWCSSCACWIWTPPMPRR
jgi:hypothetical protein